MDLTIVIVSWNTAALLEDCLCSIEATVEDLDCRVVVVDNASPDSSPDMVEANFPAVQLIRSSVNLGFAGGNNLGIRACDPDSPYILLLNSDTVVQPGALKTLIRFMDEHPETGICGPRLLLPDGTPQHYSFGRDPTLPYLIARGLKQGLLGRSMHNWATEEVQKTDWVSGACMLVRRSAIDQVGLLDERFFMYFEDNDWCLRMRKAGWEIRYFPDAAIVHLGGQSLKHSSESDAVYYRSLLHFYAKHYGRRSQATLRALLFLAGRLPRAGT